MELILKHEWASGHYPAGNLVGDQVDQIIDSGLEFDDLLENLAHKNASLSRGAWEGLLRIAQKSE